MASERLQRRIQRLLDQIDEAEAQEKWESVRNLAQDVLEADPDNPEAIAYLGSAERRLNLVPGNTAETIPSFEDALAFSRMSGYRPELAWTCCDYADLLRERYAEGDRAKSIALLDESLAISS